MPSLRVLLRIALILVLCTDGIFSAWAATRMAVNELGRATQSSASHHSNATAAQAKAKAADVAAGVDAGKQTAGHDPASPLAHHDDCDCDGLSGCACSCMLTFFPGRNAPLFAAQYLLASAYLAQPLLPPAGEEISRLFRPPIA
ncbi:CopL family metal-binding regulatory protein [Lysobacter capsici]|uniref:CopL family metal-binding regulatory protein n=1 Tax=Lysobacter capsici TaxID=435897 RepID=UPI001C007714|nr:CopL family metal-binding regulatory protein [Lysobacter capsici]QWF17089.1 CopL family metal-binding regulatory protein [Lysobacter capsici]